MLGFYDLVINKTDLDIDLIKYTFLDGGRHFKTKNEKKKKHTNDDIVMIVIRAKMETVWRNKMMRVGDAEP